MAIIKCKMCGGDLVIEQGNSVAECEYCGTMQTVPNVDDEKKVTLFARANRLRANNEFDKASGIYESIVADFPEESEAYWGLVLCKYGIEYVDDPATAKKIPTCHRSSFESVMDDNNFELTLEYADVVARKVYREEAKQIEEIRKGIIEVSSKEEPYDIFICYKETDENGDRTIDSVLAQDIYDALDEKGYRTFFARITLEDKLGQEYEPYIFAALNSAKIMLAVGTDYEYYNAVWVKNEWSRFLKLMATDKSKHLIPCYKNIDAYDMPKEFARLQAQDLGKVGAMQDLMRGVEKILPKHIATNIVINTNVNTTANAGALTRRGYIMLEDGEWDSALSYFDQALNENPEDGKAYLGKVLATFKQTNAEDLRELYINLEAVKDFGRAIRFSKGDDKACLESILEYTNKKVIIGQFRNGLRKIAKIKEKAEILAEYAKAEEERTRTEEEKARIKAEKEKTEAAERQKRIPFLRSVRNKNSFFCNFISTGNWHAIGLNSDGTVVTCGAKYDGYREHDVDKWNDIIAVSANTYDSVGLKSDGTVVTTGKFDVSEWTDIIAISADDNRLLGLKSDGTVVASGKNHGSQCETDKWTDIVAISEGHFHSLGLKSDGTVVVEGYDFNKQCNVLGWTDIVAISAGYHSLGLKSDGTVVAAGDNEHGECDVSEWTDIVAISAGYLCSFGLKSDGTVVACGDCEYGLQEINTWCNIVAISGGVHSILGLKSDGTVVACGRDRNDACKEDVSDWKLFNDYNNIENECMEQREVLRQRQLQFEQRQHAEEQRKLQTNRRQQGVCQHCGGAFKGLFTKKCTNCGKEKDY